MSRGRVAGSLGALTLAAALMIGCSSKSDSGAASTVIDVVSTDDACTLSADSAPVGKIQFAVKNEGSQVTEFYLYAADGKKIIGEVENVGPGVSRKASVSVAAGAYIATCKPGEKGDGIRSDFTVG
jgi:iron uptake system component EfeO